MARPGRKPGTPKTGGRKPGSANRRTTELLEGFRQAGFDPATELGKFLKDPTVSADVKATLWPAVLRFIYPERRAIDPTNYITLEQASGMLGAQASRFRAVLMQHITNTETITTILGEVRHANGRAEGVGALPPA